MSQEIERICIDIEYHLEDIENLRESCEIVGLDRMADQLAEIAKGLRLDIAALRAQRPRKGKGIRLLVNNAR